MLRGTLIVSNPLSNTPIGLPIYPGDIFVLLCVCVCCFCVCVLLGNLNTVNICPEGKLGNMSRGHYQLVTITSLLGGTKLHKGAIMILKVKSGDKMVI